MNKIHSFLLVRRLYDKKVINSGLEIRNFSSRVQLDISLVRCAFLPDIKLNTGRGMLLLRASMNETLFTEYLVVQVSENCL